MGVRGSGRRPLPTKLKLLRGETRTSRLNHREPQPPSGVVRKPSGLSRHASRVWDGFAPTVRSMGTLTRADVPAFTILCELMASFEQVVTRQGSQRDRDALRRLAGALRPYLECFGLTPSARTRIAVSRAEAPVSRWAGDIDDTSA